MQQWELIGCRRTAQPRAGEIVGLAAERDNGRAPLILQRPFRKQLAQCCAGHSIAVALEQVRLPRPFQDRRLIRRLAEHEQQLRLKPGEIAK